jgi:hypothetical protein
LLLLAFNSCVWHVKMEELMAAPVEEGKQPKSVAQIVAEVLTKECPSST